MGVPNGLVMELVDLLVLETSAERRGGSSPPLPTNIISKYKLHRHLVKNESETPLRNRERKVSQSSVISRARLNVEA